MQGQLKHLPFFNSRIKEARCVAITATLGITNNGEFRPIGNYKLFTRKLNFGIVKFIVMSSLGIKGPK